MKTLDECKQKWAEAGGKLSFQKTVEEPDFKKIVNHRVARQIGTAMKYFWASYALQIIIYSLAMHVIVTFWHDTETVILGTGSIILYIPFTIMLLKKFKQIAGLKPEEKADKGSSLYQYTKQQRDLLQSFYNFKRTYEFMLIPLSAVIGIVITFKLYVPGGVAAHPAAAGITFIITMASCITAIVSENKKRFDEPIRQLQGILGEFTNEV